MSRFLLLIIFILFLGACGAETVLPNRSLSPGSDGGEDDGAGDTGDVDAAVTLGCRAKGFNFPCWYEGCYRVPGVTRALLAASNMGSNWIEIVPTWYQDDKEANEISGNSDRGPTLADLRYIIPLAREYGLQIALKPHVDLLDGDWRGNIAPSNLSSWQASYEDFILTFASLAQSLGVEVLSIGTELKTRSGDTLFWRQLVPKIREVYTGLLTYSANWDEYDGIVFWDLLDFVGIDFYFPLTDDPDADQEAMEEGLNSIHDDLQTFSAARGRPFLFTEIGYRSIDGMNLRPYDFDLSGAVDFEEQADAYAAVLTVFGEEDWLEGIFWWRLDPRLTSDDDDYSPYGKPAEDILKTFWGGDLCEDEA